MTCISFYMCVHANVIMLNSVFVHTIHICALEFADTHVHVSNTHAKFDLCAFWHACGL